MGVLKFFAAIFGVSDALSEDEKRNQKAANIPRIQRLRAEERAVVSELERCRIREAEGEEPTQEERARTASLERKKRDLAKLISLYENL